MESNLPSPYECEDDGDGYHFVNKHGVRYHIYFIDKSGLHPKFDNVYSFNIEPEGSEEETRHPIDNQIASTIVAILSRFFQKNENAMLMVCDTLDGKEQKRRKLFDRWFAAYNHNLLIKLDASLDADEYVILASIYFRHDNPNRRDLEDAFNELINTEDVDELAF